MSITYVLNLLSGALFLGAFVPYIIAIWRGFTKPSLVTWLVWAGLDYIVVAGMLAQETLNGQILGACAGATAVVVLALWRGTTKWSKLDVFCLASAVLGVVLWQMAGNPNIAILTSAATALIASIPTFVSAWNDPSRENKTAWTIFWVSCVVALLAVPAWDVANAAQPVTFTIIETTMMYLLFLHRGRAQTTEATAS